MNKKGYTLIELITTIAILSILSVVIITSIFGTTHFMLKGNQIKTASNDMYSYFENADGAEITPTFKQKGLQNIKYQLIVNSKTINVSGTMVSVESTDDTKTKLKKVKNTSSTILDSESYYKAAMSEASKLFVKIDSLKGFYCYTGTCSIYDYSYILGALNKTGDIYIEFDKSMLPDGISGPYYIRVCYPWLLSDAGEMDPLVYLSKENIGLVDGKKNENVQIVFDYKNNKWYYQPKANIYQMPNYGNAIKSSANDYLVNDFKYRGNDITSYDKLMNSIMNNTTDPWKELNGSAILGDYSNYWVSIEK